MVADMMPVMPFHRKRLLLFSALCDRCGPTSARHITVLLTVGDDRYPRIDHLEERFKGRLSFTNRHVKQCVQTPPMHTGRNGLA